MQSAQKPAVASRARVIRLPVTEKPRASERNIPKQPADSGPDNDQQAWSLQARYIIASSIVCLIILLFAISAEIYAGRQYASNKANIINRNTVSHTLNAAHDAVASMHNSLNDYLLSPDKKVLQQWNNGHGRFRHLVTRLSLSPWIEQKNLGKKIALIEAALDNYYRHAQEIFSIRRTPSKQNPTFQMALDSMLPRNRAFMTQLTLAIGESYEERHSKEGEKIHLMLLQLRHHWTRMISGFRMYFFNRSEVFATVNTQNLEREIFMIHDEVMMILKQLEKYKGSDAMGLATETALAPMKKSAVLWIKGLRKIQKAHKSSHWRSDIIYKNTRILPAYSLINTRLLELNTLIEQASAEDIGLLNALTGSMTNGFWILAFMTIAMLVIGMLYLRHSVFKPISLLSVALKKAADGDNSTSLPSANIVETRNVIDAFHEMSNQVHSRQSALRHQALHDSLTGLPNRNLLQDRTERALAEARHNRHTLALMLIDLNRFKEINDTLGHHAGDVVLKHVSDRLKECLRETDTVARLGGDEFAILVPDADKEKARLIADKIHDSVEQELELDGQKMFVGASIGIALFPEHGDNYAILMQRADVAMYQSKRNKQNYALYDAHTDENSADRLTLVSDLRNAIAGSEIGLHYQPLVDNNSGRTIGVEALLRWEHDQHGPISPDQIVLLAENTGLIHSLTSYVINTAVCQNRLWKDSGFDIRVCINLSAMNLQDRNLVDEIDCILERWNMPPSSLALEITESAFMSDIETAIETLNNLYQRGISLSVDDYGTGFSSLAYLKRLPVSELKIDKSFILNMTDDDNDAVIVRSTIDLAHNLGLRVVAEGVENRDTLELLKLLGCDITQGYYLSRPVPAAKVCDWLKQHG